MSASEIQPARTISEFRFNSPELPVDKFGTDFPALVDEAPCNRIIWDYRIYAGAGRPVAEQRISVWLRHDKDPAGKQLPEPMWRLYYQLVSDLYVEAYDGKGDTISDFTNANNAVFIQDGAIVLQGGYLEVHDPGLVEPLLSLGLELGPTLETLLSSEKCEAFVFPDKVSRPSNLGRSIHLEVDFAGPVEAPAVQPLFYFPQDDRDNPAPNLGPVILGVQAEGETRRLLWAISNAALRSAPYDTGVPELQHTLTVSADYNWPGFGKEGDNKVAWYELLVDSLGLFPEPLLWDDEAAPPTDPANLLFWRRSRAKPSVHFGRSKRKFYIGFAPGDWSGPFHGRIYRIFFDPTTNCNNC